MDVYRYETSNLGQQMDFPKYKSKHHTSQMNVHKYENSSDEKGKCIVPLNDLFLEDSNPFLSSASFLYPLKTLENLNGFLMLSWGGERVHWEQMG